MLTAHIKANALREARKNKWRFLQFKHGSVPCAKREATKMSFCIKACIRAQRAGWKGLGNCYGLRVLTLHLQTERWGGNGREFTACKALVPYTMRFKTQFHLFDADVWVCIFY